MGQVLDMQFMRYINLFEKITRVRTSVCFSYNNFIVFGVKKQEVSDAIGKNASNVKEIAQVFGKKVKIVGMPKDKTQSDVEEFVSSLIAPAQFNKFEIVNNEAVLGATMENKAILIGRNSQRQKELEEILKRYFDISGVKII